MDVMHQQTSMELHYIWLCLQLFVEFLLFQISQGIILFNYDSFHFPVRSYLKFFILCRRRQLTMDFCHYLYSQIFLNRGTGVFGEARITWQIIPRNDAFVQHQGEAVFADQQQETSIVLQVYSIKTNIPPLLKFLIQFIMFNYD